MADLTIRQGDTLPALAQTILDASGSPMDLTGCSVQFVMRSLNASAPTVNAAATVITAAAGSVQYPWEAEDTSTAGLFMAEFHVTTGSGGAYTFPSDGYLEIDIDDNLTTPGGSYLVSLPDAKQYLNIPSDDHSEDAKLLRFIDAARPAIENTTGPIILQQFEEWHDGGQVFIRVRRRPSTAFGTTPVLLVQAISEYNGPIEWPLVLVSSPDLGQLYSAQVDLQRGRVVRRTAGGGVQPFPMGPQSVHLWYVAGQTTVPANVYEATLELIRIHFQRSQQQGALRGPGVGFPTDDEGPSQPIIGFYLPGIVREMLGVNRRHPALA